MNGDKVAHALGEVEGTLRVLVDSHKNVANRQDEHAKILAQVVTRLNGLPCKEHGAELNKIRWSFVKLALSLIGAGGAGGGIAAAIMKLWGG